MNKILKYILPASACFLAACNDIDEAGRFIDLPPITSDRVVLIEDFTGQRCKNCPDAHVIISQLEAQYPGQVVSVAVHAGGFSVPVTNTAYEGLRQPFGDDMASHRSVTEYPSGIIDGKGPLLHTDWAAAVYDALKVPALSELSVGEIVIDYNEHTLSGVVKMMPGVSADALLGIWILENGIVTRQTDNTGKWIREYEHNHVLRTYVGSSPWGEPVHLERDIESQHSFSVTLDAGWETDNIQVVAFLTDIKTGEYLQTTIASVKE